MWSDLDDPLDTPEEIGCRETLGGVLRHYERVAA
jgi:hypothetical protein